jgi:mono/diheme cytochrome c family protein
VKLSQLQASIFTPKCTACHDGSGTVLPGVQNLSAGNTYANIVNVASIEVPSLKRAAPGSSANSYVVQKLEGAASISGVRMPKGGPYLDEATIALVKAWIDAGAANN